jgi:hypothetical protein
MGPSAAAAAAAAAAGVSLLSVRIDKLHESSKAYVYPQWRSLLVLLGFCRL